MATPTDDLSSELDTGPDSEFSSPYYSSSPPLGLECSEPGAFDLVDDDLVLLSSDDFQIPSPTHSEVITVASEIETEKILKSRNDQVFKYTRTADGTCHRIANFLKSKTRRPKLGAAFSEFLLGNAEQDKDDFLTTLGRDFIKKICFCVGAERLGFEKVFKESAKLHSSGTKNVKVPASETTKALYKRLFSLYLTIPDREILHTYGRSICDIKKDKNYKSFNVEFQRFVYAPREMRLFYRYYVEFLDWFGQEGAGVKLRQEMKFKTQETREIREEMTYGYLQALELRPVDKLTRKEIFRIELDSK